MPWCNFLSYLLSEREMPKLIPWYAGFEALDVVQLS